MKLTANLNQLLDDVINDPKEYTPAELYDSEYRQKLLDVFAEMKTNSLDFEDIDDIEPIINGYTFNGPDNGFDLYELVQNIYYYFKLNKDKRTYDKLKNTLLYSVVLAPEFSIYLQHNIFKLFDDEMKDTFLKSEGWTVIYSLTLSNYAFYFNNIIDDADSTHCIDTEVTVKTEEPELTTIKPVKLSIEEIKAAPAPNDPNIYNNCLNSISVAYSYDKDDESKLKFQDYTEVRYISEVNPGLLIGIKKAGLRENDLTLDEVCQAIIDKAGKDIIMDPDDLCVKIIKNEFSVNVIFDAI